MEQMIKTLMRFGRNRKAISGLETAIVLISFVIVASAFAYAVLNMGFLATQKSQEVAVGGLQAASAALVIDGPVYAYSTQTGATANLTSIIFWLKTASGADSVDLNANMTTVAYENPRGVWPNIYNSGSQDLVFTVDGTTYTAKYTGGKTAFALSWEVGSGMLLDRNEKVRVTIDLTALQTSIASAGQLQKNEEKKIIVKPPKGAILDIVRYAPPEVKTVNDLD
jgi:flagellin FlaB